jgi:hypothetical protein
MKSMRRRYRSMPMRPTMARMRLILTGTRSGQGECLACLYAFG